MPSWVLLKFTVTCAPAGDMIVLVSNAMSSAVRSTVAVPPPAAPVAPVVAFAAAPVVATVVMFAADVVATVAAGVSVPAAVVFEGCMAGSPVTEPGVSTAPGTDVGGVAFGQTATISEIASAGGSNDVLSGWTSSTEKVWVPGFTLVKVWEV